MGIFFFFSLGWSLTESTILCSLYSNVGFSKIRQGKLLLRDFYFFSPWLIIRSGLDAEDYETLSPTILRNGVAISHSLQRHASLLDWLGLIFSLSVINSLNFCSICQLRVSILNKIFYMILGWYLTPNVIL